MNNKRILISILIVIIIIVLLSLVRKQKSAIKPTDEAPAAGEPTSIPQATPPTGSTPDAAPPGATVPTDSTAEIQILENEASAADFALPADELNIDAELSQ